MMQNILECTLADLDFKQLKIKDRVLLVTGRKSYIDSGAASVLSEKLQGKDVIQFFDFKSNPQLEDVVKGMNLMDRDKPFTIIAVGGGSPMDVAKLIKALSCQKHDPADYIRGSRKLVSNEHINLIAIPTTSGSGSESTHFAVVYMEKMKYSLAYQDLLPESVVLDYTLTKTMSPYQTACTGFDALAQAVESYWSVNGSDESRGYSREAIGLITKHLLSAVNAPDNADRLAMQKAANLAGRAINLTKTTAAHAFCYYLTSHYGVPHGHAVGLLLGKFFVFNSRISVESRSDASTTVKAVQERILELCHLLGASSALEADTFLNKLLRECGLESDIGKIMDIDQEFDDFFSSVNVQRLGNNPRKVEDQDELLNLLKA
ncbi:MAG: hypothetical protein B6241_01110 [Spirochaetaceae bacterium 4572_59]|nr:MAG: hypothetical protein B6241_01110 [Spirochaetaceae bacterium 4572_59]